MPVFFNNRHLQGMINFYLVATKLIWLSGLVVL